jgi:hypothetical protein
VGGMRRRRLETLEHRRRQMSPAPLGERRPPNGEESKRRWLTDARVRRHDDTHSGEEFYARDVFRLLRSQGRLPDTTKGLRAALLAWRPPLEKRAVERVLARVIFDEEAGTEGMACPPAWRDAFEAAEVLRDRYLSADPEVLARALVTGHDLEEEENDEAMEERLAEEMAAALERLGMTDELHREALGPDIEEITEQERERRLSEILADFYYSEHGYEVQLCVWRLVSEEEGGAPV